MASNLKDLNEHLATRSFINGKHQATQEDADRFATMPSTVDMELYPHVWRWHKQMSYEAVFGKTEMSVKANTVAEVINEPKGKQQKDKPSPKAGPKDKPSPKAKAKAEPKAKADKKGGKKDVEEPKEKTPEEKAADRKAQMKKVVKEGGKRGVEIEGAADMGGLQAFCTSVDEPKGDLEFLKASMGGMNEVSNPEEEERKGGSGAIIKMLFSAGDDQLAVCAYVPEAKKEELDAAVWLKTVLDTNGGEVCEGATGTLALGFIKMDSAKGRFPLKMKEPSITEAITYLKKKGLFPDTADDSDDDYVFGDDDFPQ